MAQSALTVTPDGPTPPTNFTGQIGMRPPTTAGLNPIDDGTAGSLILFAAPSAGGANFEGAGTEVSVTAPGSRAECPTIAVSDLGAYTTSPNGDHASSLSPTTNPTISSLVPQNIASGAGTNALAVNGAHFTPQSVVYVNGVPQVTSFISSVQINVAAAPKKATAGNLPVTVVTGGAVTTAPTNWVFT
jgi:hypothetical protein